MTVTIWATIFLGVIALATLATSIVQIGVLVEASRLARRIERLVDRLEHEVTPILAHLDTIGRDASRAASLAASQVERVDRLLARVAERLEATLDAVETSIARPAREAAALVAGLRTALSVFRDMKAGRGRRRAEDHEDALFI